ncbi:TIGR02453 family protein [Sinisalibacter aestuarii]|uniref:TIGR02453 family protein n=1 Tax=Sinisalibacter aestuarii TaxID=2949426 RepID=A0ABQ5M083_9RHOB|nr:TIGR02453 family protein [Sinisalibacter aestuarii]GKY90205.1 TIGR02453 family protein [Sinisalibacter aestuarii]
MAPQDRLIPDALGFFDALAAHNSRDWFAAHKDEYEAAVKRPADALLRETGDWLAAETGVAQAAKLYRIHRDLRFSKDKTPYNTHLHLQWSDPARGICHLFGVSRDYVCAGVGAMAFSAPALERWRGAVGADGAEIAAEIAAMTGTGHRLDPPALKRVPAPYPQDHAQGALLRHKGIVLWHDFTDAERNDPAAALRAAFTRLAPFRKALATVLG